MPTCKEKVLAKFPETEDLGEYTAEVGRTSLHIHLTSKLYFMAAIDPGSDEYSAEVRFGDMAEKVSLNLKYHPLSVRRFVGDLKAFEGVIENVLDFIVSPARREDWRESHEVLKCIFSLEERMNQVHEQREKLQGDRNYLVYGERNPTSD